MSKKIIQIILGAFIMVMLSGLPAAAANYGGEYIEVVPPFCNPKNVTYKLTSPPSILGRDYSYKVSIELDDEDKVLIGTQWTDFATTKYYSYTGCADGRHSVYVMFAANGGITGIQTSKVFYENIWFDSTPPICGGIYQLNQSNVNITSTEQDYKIVTIPKDVGACPSGITRVWMFTWTEKNGQDDFKFYECKFDDAVIPGTNVTSGWVGTVSLSDHNNEEGKYITHIFAQDGVGNMGFMGAVEMIVDKTAPDAAIISTSAQVLNADTINIEGTAEAGAKVNVSGGTSPATGTVGADGKFSVNTGLKQDQVNNISVVAEDGAGHQSGPSNVVTITEDSTPPTISSISASATFTTEDYFEVNAIAADSGSGIAKVVFPTWTTSNGQDDLIWHEGIRGASGKFYYNVNKNEHNNETGQYLTDAYAYDYAGNCAGKARLTVNVETPPPVKPTITTASQFINADTINIEGTAEAGKKVTVSGGTSSAAGIAGADGKFSVNIGLNQDQVNNISVYAEDDKGNKSDTANVTITEDSTPPVISSIFTLSASWDRGSLSLYTKKDAFAGGAFITDNFGIQSVKFPTWSAKNWQDDLVWHDGISDPSGSVEQFPGDSGEFWYSIKDLSGDPGNEDQYFTDVYAYDKAGNYTCKSRLSVTIDKTYPAAPTLITEAQTTNADTIYIEGIAEAGSTILILRNYDGTSYESDAPTGSNGIFRVNVPLDHNKVNNLEVYALDAARNASPESIVAITHTDDPILTAAITTSVGNSTNISLIPVTITFSKAVTGFEMNDIIVTNGTKADFSGRGTTYTVNITPAANELVVTVAVPANAAIDDESNGNPAAPSLSIYYDNTKPTIIIKSDTADSTDSQSIPVNITFNEAVTGFEMNDIAVTNGTKADFTGSGTTYAVVIIPASNGVVTIDVPAGAASDESGNGNSAASTLSITCTAIKPTVSIAAGSSNISPVAATFTFSEAVTGFELTDIIVANGTAEDLQGSGTTYTADIKPAAEGLVSIDVPSGAAIDAVGNGNQAAPRANITYDAAKPTVNISSAVNANPTNLSFIPVTITFSEAVTSFDSGDVTISKGTIEEFSGSGTTYTMRVKPDADGIVTVDVAANAAGDECGNGNTPAAQISLTYDGSKPAVSISAGVTKTNSNTPIPVTIAFSEAVTGFDLGDISVGNGTPTDFNGSGTTYTLNVTPAAEGLVTVNVPANAASDATGNNNTSSALLSISYDTTKPAASIYCTTNTISSTNVTSIPVVIMFNKAVTGFAQEDINVTNGDIYNLTGSGTNYIADIKTSGQRFLKVNVAADIAQDEYGNSNAGAALDISNVEIPSLTAEPDDITILTGQTASLSVAASVSQGDLTYQWYSNTTSSNSDGLEITGETGSTYSAPGTTAGTYYYYCTITNTDNTATAYTTATINSKVAAVNVNGAAAYGISLSESGTYTFAEQTEGYSTLAAHAVTVSNTGNQATGALAVALSGTSADSFALSKTFIDSIAESGSDSFTIKPQDGLATGTYTADVTVSGSNIAAKSFGVSFTVNSVDVVDIDATISPTSISYDLNAPAAAISTTITWNNASTVTDAVYGTTSLTTPDAYVVSGNALTIKGSYLDAMGLLKGDKVEFRICFDKGNSAPLTVDIVEDYTANENSNLSNLTVNGSMVSGFEPKTTTYDVELPYGTSSALVGATPEDAHAAIVITQANPLPGNATVEVIAEDKTTAKVYTIHFTLGAPSTVPVASITVTGTGGAIGVEVGSTLQMLATVLPSNATNKNVIWSIESGSGASIDADGLLTATSAGSVTVRATAQDGSCVYNEEIITITTPSPAAHSINVENDGHGTGSANLTSAVQGTTITLSSSPNSGYHFKEWQVISPMSLSITGNSFTMPDDAVTVSAVFEADAVTACTVTFNSDGLVYATKTVQASASIGSGDWPANPTKSGYTFQGWFTGINGSGSKYTSVTPVNATMTLYAKWTSNGGGGSSGSSAPSTPETSYTADIKVTDTMGNVTTETTLPVTVDADNRRATVNVSAQSNLMSGGRTSVIALPSFHDVDTYTLGIPVSYLSESDKQGTLTVDTDMGCITIPSNMLTGATGLNGNKADISIGQSDKSSLSEAAKAAIGDRPLIQLSLSIDGKQTEWNNPDAPVTISIPYTPTAAELLHPESIVIWYIDGSGNAVSVPNGHYDPAIGIVTFTTTHFSDYAVGYNQVYFNDVAAGAWYNQAVSFIVARGITTGTGGENFSPDAKLTRSQFIVMLMKSYGIAPDMNPKNNFSDAGNAYYTGYLAAAKRLGISAGVGNDLYAPEREITRQEMFALLYNALKVIGQLPQGDSGKTISNFTDVGQISSWAKEALTLLIKTGTIGGNAGKLNPTSTTTRAEMAQVLYNLLSS